jgi:hypothetical protein
MSTTITPERIAELWPALSPEARQQIAEIVEADAVKDMPLDLSAEEERLLAQALDDFKQGRALNAGEYRAEMSAFMKRLAAQAAS